MKARPTGGRIATRRREALIYSDGPVACQTWPSLTVRR